MMDLRKIGPYSIGLDLGTGSVGWAVIDDAGDLAHFRGKPAWGSRIFPTAETAADARSKRGQRRRYVRRTWRLSLLQSIFEEEMTSLDPAFFCRLKNSYKVAEDRTFHHPLFNGHEFDERDYYQKFPTIYHLRAWLMETDDKADLRLIYLAFHNIIKARGNFLYQDEPDLSAKKANTLTAVERFASELEACLETRGFSCSCNIDGMCRVLEDASKSRREKQEALQGLFGLDASASKLMAKSLSGALVGYQVNLAPVFDIESSNAKLKLSDDEKVEALQAELVEDTLSLFEAMREVYSAYVLSGILNNNDGEPINSGALHGSKGSTISYCKVREYVRYGQDLKLLKRLVKKYAPASYDSFFRGEMYLEADGSSSGIYDKTKISGYTKYDEIHSASSYDELKKSIRTLLDGTDAATDLAYKDVLQGLEEERFLRRLKTGDNGSIPYQLHLEEMSAIILNQGKYYPFLLTEQKKIESLVSFRIPYYVGPLTQKNAAVDKKGNKRFTWSVRKAGKENERVYPWNWEEIIDKHESAYQFINRMTSDCTYLFGEPTLPKSSLLYEEFCVLNELNGARFSCDGDDFRRFDAADRQGIVRDLFMKRKTVKYQDVAEWMERNHGLMHVKVKGGQGETKFESKLSSNFFFCRDVFGVNEISKDDYPMIEKIILWNTIFEDRAILKEELKRHYADRLSDEQITKICRKRLTGWGRLSEKLLVGLKAQTENGYVSIMDVLRGDDPNPSAGANRTMVFMEVLHSDYLGFEKLIEEKNASVCSSANALDVNELPGSPALRRTINQAIRIVKEIVKVAGHQPEAIYIENTHEDREKGKRTKRRYESVKEALASLKEQSVLFNSEQVRSEFKERRPADFDDDRLMLYFLQNGKCMYTGEPLKVEALSSYQVDHIIPQAYVKDDSLENKVLVLSSANQAKSDGVIGADIRRKCAPMWKALHDAGCMGDKKYNNLMRGGVSDRQVKGFIARQLVETSQINKLTKIMLNSAYPDTRVVSVRASLSSSLRRAKGYVKCRDINDYHHAHDALLAAELGRYLMTFHSGAFENPVGYAKVIREFVRQEAKKEKKPGYRPGSVPFFVANFMHDHVNTETGEIWEGERVCEKIRGYLNYRQCFISRMPEETSGAFWKATIYSPRSPKGNLPTKADRPIGKYGMYSTERYAYFFIYEVADAKGKRKLVWSSVPVSVAAATEGGADALATFAKQEAESKGMRFVRIVRPKVYKYQLIEVGQNRLFVTGKKEARNAFQLAFNQEDTALIKSLLAGEMVDDKKVSILYEKVNKALQLRARRLYDLLKIEGTQQVFDGLSTEEKSVVLRGLLQISAAAVNMIDLSGLRLPKKAGCLQLTFSKILNSSGGITFVDQSVTGMFERRTHVGI